jgi:hypothetical protein
MTKTGKDTAETISECQSIRRSQRSLERKSHLIAGHRTSCLLLPL